ncbi:MAG: tRNA pseudouridine(55) synthase TruB [Longimicrobiales bacterium]
MKIDPGADYVLRVDKPVGPTSHDIVAQARRALHTRRVGHTGTLDPFASGLLLLCVNRATRIAEFLSGLSKTYLATARLDGFTATDDHTGGLLEPNDAWRSLTAARIESAMRTLTGSIEQTPPAYSAKKVQGERGYRRARRGETVELAPVRVQVDRLELLDLALPDVRFAVECSSGTYVRALARDLGRALGTGAYLTGLRRTRLGRFQVDDAIPAAALDHDARVEQAALSPLEALSHLPALEVGEEDAQRLRHGQAVVRTAAVARTLLVVTSHGELVALAREDGQHLLPFKVWQAA